MLVCHKLACITYPTKKLVDFYNNQSLQRAFGYSSAYTSSTNIATLQSSDSRRLLGGVRVRTSMSVYYDSRKNYRCYLWHKQSQSNSLQGHTKLFCSYLGIEQSGSD